MVFLTKTPSLPLDPSFLINPNHVDLLSSTYFVIIPLRIITAQLLISPFPPTNMQKFTFSFSTLSCSILLLNLHQHTSEKYSETFAHIDSSQ
jgi:hypothetical protein